MGCIMLLLRVSFVLDSVMLEGFLCRTVCHFKWVSVEQTVTIS